MLGQWFDITSEEDCAKLMQLVSHFHDGCLREVHLTTGIFVKTDLAMSFGPVFPNDVSARLLIQRQWPSPSAIELLFDGVRKLNVVGHQTDIDPIIYDSTLKRVGDLYYWADIHDWDPSDADRDESTWIGATSLRWRDVSDWMGPEMRYGPVTGQPSG